MSESSSSSYWRKCGSCKKEIPFNTIYQACEISSCQKFVYCSLDCWGLHNSIMNHKNAWAEERCSPRQEEIVLSAPAGDAARRRIIIPSKSSSPANEAGKNSQALEDEILIVVSKLKQYIKEKYDFNTSASVMEILSSMVRRRADLAVEKARREGRKTVMDRDFD